MRTKLAGGAILILLIGFFGVSAILRNAGATRPPLTPVGADGKPAALELPVGGPAPGAATPVSDASAPTVTAAAAPAAAATGPVVVHVAGAVRHPGVYRFHAGDRINDAVVAAGGFLDAADRDALNLADRLQDADQIYVPTRQESGTAAAASGATAASVVVSATSAGRRRHALITHGTSTPAFAPAPASRTTVSGTTRATTADPTPGLGAPPADSSTPVSGPNDSLAYVAHSGRVIGRSSPDPTDGSTPAPDPGALSDATGGPGAIDGLPAKTNRGSTGESSRSSGRGASSKSGKFKNPGDGVVHLNSATAEQLEKLPGVGAAMSGRILDYRAQIGRFTDVKQLRDVKGIGDKKFAKMEDFLAL